MKYILMALAVSNFLLASHAGDIKVGRAKIPVVNSHGEIHVQVGNIPTDIALFPSQALSAALKQDKKSQKFRVLWSGYGVGYSSSSTALYNRKNKSLKFYKREFGGLDEFYGEGFVSVI